MRVVLMVFLKAIFLMNIAGASLAQADCLPVIEEKIVEKEENLLFAKQTQKKVVKGTFYGVGATSGLLWGTLFHLIADGTTLPISILVGAGHGAVFGAAAVAVVGIPMLAYNQYIKYQIRGMEKVARLIDQANRFDYEAPELSSFYQDIKADTNAGIGEVASWIVEGSESRDFCPENGKVLGLNDIKNHLLGRTNDKTAASKGSVELIIELEERQLDAVQAAPVM